MKYCPKCRKKLVVEDFCAECGLDLKNYSNNTNKSNKESDKTDGFNSIDFSIFEKEAKRQLENQRKLEEEKQREQKLLEEKKRLEAQEKKRLEEEKLKEQKRLEEQKLLEEKMRMEKQKRQRLAAEKEEARRDSVYASAKEKMKKRNLNSVKEAKSMFQSISGWRDSVRQIESCNKLIEEINSEIKLEKDLEQARKYEIARHEYLKKKLPKRILLSVVVALLTAAFAVVYIKNLMEIDRFSMVFYNCWIEYGAFAVCFFLIGILIYKVEYFGEDDFGNVWENLLFALVGLIIVGFLVLPLIFIDTIFILRVVILIIRGVPEVVIGLMACGIGISLSEKI